MVANISERHYCAVKHAQGNLSGILPLRTSNFDEKI